MFTKLIQECKKQKLKIAIVLGLFAIGTFLAIAFSSFFFTWSIDQSELLSDTTIKKVDPAVESPADFVFQNWAGKLGAKCSKKFIHDWFGIGSFAIVFLCFFLIAKIIFRNRIQLSLRKGVFISISMMLILSITLGFFCNDLWDGNLGGCLGYFLSYQLLQSTIGTFFTGLILILIDFAYIIFTFDKVYNFCEAQYHRLTTPPTQEQEEQTEYSESTTEIQTEDTNETEQFKEEHLDSDNNSNIPTIENNSEEPQQVEIKQTPIEPQHDDILETNTLETVDATEETNSDNDHEKLNDENSQEENDKENIEEEQPDDEQDEDTTDNQNTDEQEDDSNNQDETPEETSDRIKIDGMIIKDTNKPVGNNDDIKMEMKDYDPKEDLSHFQQPGIDLLKIYDNDLKKVEYDEDEILGNRNLIEKTLRDFKIEIDSISSTIGPTITLYEIVPKAGTRISKIQSLEKDIMMSLEALGIRIIAPIPGKGTVGIEVPNKKRQTVSMYSVINSPEFKESKMELPVALGKTITNEVYMFDLAKMPHLLVAGATGQGKSVGLNAIVTSLLYKKHPSQLKFVLVDPKMVEFSIYAGLKNHYMAQYPGEEDIIITDCAKVKQTLNSLVQEMEDRYKLLMDAHCRNIIEYNDKFIHRQLNPYKGHKYLAYIVIIIDEFGDFIMQAGKEIETPIARIAQKARAVGMHLILATQRPSVNVITGLIKANIPGRIAFRTASGIDSSTILDERGAEGLTGKGDLLVSSGQKPERVQCAFVDTPEVERIVSFIQEQQGYGEPMQLPEVKESAQSGGMGSTSNSDNGNDELDPIFEDAARLVVGGNAGSTSLIQRKFSLGYNRAGRVMDQLEHFKIVGPAQGSKPREVITDIMGLEQILTDLREKGLIQ